MTEKQNAALEKIINALPNDYQEVYREIAQYAISLGYVPQLKGAHGTYVVFNKIKINRIILKIIADPKFPPSLEMKFFANSSYSEFFKKALVERLSWWDHPACNGCGKCDGTHGYTYTYPDGKQRFMCGFSLISLPPVHVENVPEIKDALKKQDDLYTQWFNV